MGNENMDLDQLLAEIHAEVQPPPESREVGKIDSPALDASFGGEGFPRLYEVPSSKAGSEPYTVTFVSELVATCSCPGFSYRRYCRHLREAELMDQAERQTHA